MERCLQETMSTDKTCNSCKLLLICKKKISPQFSKDFIYQSFSEFFKPNCGKSGNQSLTPNKLHKIFTITS